MRKLFKFSLYKGKLNEETIWNVKAFMNSKKNSCRGNYMRKYGIYSMYKQYVSKNLIYFFIFDLNPHCCCFRCRVFFMTILWEDSWQQPMIIIGNPFRYINSLLIDNSDLSGHWAIRHQRLVWLLQYICLVRKICLVCLGTLCLCMLLGGSMVQ